MGTRICDIKGCTNKHYAKGLCQQHYSQQYHQENRERQNKRSKDYYKTNKKEILARQDSEKKREYQKVYYWKNREKLLAQSREWSRNNKDKVLAQKARYRKGREEELSQRQKQRYQKQKQQNNLVLYKAFCIYDSCCQLCDEKNIIVFQWHHRDGNRKGHNESNISVAKRVVKANRRLEDVMLLCANCHTLQDLADKTSIRSSRLVEVAKLFGVDKENRP